MATSGTYVYSANALTIVTEAMETNGIVASGETLDASDLSTCLRTLNMMVKQWSGNFDFAPGLKAFSRRHGYVFLQKNQGVYNLGPTGDNASLSYLSTTMRLAAVTSATILEVGSTTGMTAADKIGIELDSGSIFWTTISSITDSDTLVIPATGLTSASAVGRRIFTYTTKLMRPLYIEYATIRDTDDNDISSLNTISLDAYENISDKGVDSTPSFYRYDNTLLNGTLYLDAQPSDVTKKLRLTFIVPAEDYNIQTDDISFPQEWYMALSLGLAKLIAPKFQQEWDATKESNYQSALMMARSSYPETTEIYFQPGLE